MPAPTLTLTFTDDKLPHPIVAANVTTGQRESREKRAKKNRAPPVMASRDSVKAPVVTKRVLQVREEGEEGRQETPRVEKGVHELCCIERRG